MKILIPNLFPKSEFGSIIFGKEASKACTTSYQAMRSVIRLSLVILMIVSPTNASASAVGGSTQPNLSPPAAPPGAPQSVRPPGGTQGAGSQVTSHQVSNFGDIYYCFPIQERTLEDRNGSRVLTETLLRRRNFLELIDFLTLPVADLTFDGYTSIPGASKVFIPETTSENISVALTAMKSAGGDVNAFQANEVVGGNFDEEPLGTLPEFAFQGDAGSSLTRQQNAHSVGHFLINGATLIPARQFQGRVLGGQREINLSKRFFEISQVQNHVQRVPVLTESPFRVDQKPSYQNMAFYPLEDKGILIQNLTVGFEFNSADSLLGAVLSNTPESGFNGLRRPPRQQLVIVSACFSSEEDLETSSELQSKLHGDFGALLNRIKNISALGFIGSDGMPVNRQMGTSRSGQRANQVRPENSVSRDDTPEWRLPLLSEVLLVHGIYSKINGQFLGGQDIRSRVSAGATLTAALVITARLMMRVAQRGATLTGPLVPTLPRSIEIDPSEFGLNEAEFSRLLTDRQFRSGVCSGLANESQKYQSACRFLRAVEFDLEIQKARREGRPVAANFRDDNFRSQSDLLSYESENQLRG